jgi:endonuclease/exonuclease/phosphatase family metal-dependent hydrolase
VRRAGVALCVLLVAACAARTEGEARVTLMTFNVENLFDTLDDPAKLDDSFLPLESKRDAAHRDHCEGLRAASWREQCLRWDWNEAALATKLDRVARTILQVNDGRGPDIVALQEVENLAVLERLRRNHLAAASYTSAILVEGDDPRGIDVAFLSRLPLRGTPRLHRVAHARRTGDVRGILEATFELPDGTLLTGYCAHFPAPGHSASTRAEAFAALSALAAELPRERLRFAAGDFNVTADEERRARVTDGLLASGWIAAHRGGCGGCRGSYYYAREREWSFLDMILVGAALDSAADGRGWRLHPRSVRVPSALPEQSTPEGHPAAFRLPQATGVSDHWPLVADIILR